MRRAIQLLALALVAPGCRGADAPAPGPDEANPDASASAVAPDSLPAPPADPPAPEIYARALAEQLDLVPANADAYMVIRDLRPLMREAHRVERVMAGPLARAIPALAELGGGTGDARLAELERVRELLALGLVALDNAGVDPSQGMVSTLGAGEPLVMFAAEDLGRLATLARALDVDLGERCRALDEPSGWTVCTLGELEALEAYAPASVGQALEARLADRLPGIDLGHVNVALSSASGERPIDLALRTDPGLWELVTPASFLDGAGALFTSGSAPALSPLAPGSSFMWARVDPQLLADLGVTSLGLDPAQLTGELCLGAIDRPSGLLARAGVRDLDQARAALEALARSLPTEAIEPAPGMAVQIELDRASIVLDGERVQTIGATITGDAAGPLSASLGLDLRARLWVHGVHLSAALGEVQAIPAALATQTRATQAPTAGPSGPLLAGLPPTLSRALRADEVGLILHLALDPWQAPTNEAELEALVDGLARDLDVAPKVAATAVAAVFESLAPWSSVSVWLGRGEGQVWLAHVSVVPFEAAGAPEEAAAASEVLDAVLAGRGSEAGYRDLAARFPRSPRAPSYRARAGDAPPHHAAVGMIELALLGALAVSDEPSPP